MLKAEMLLPEAIAAAIDELTRGLPLPRLLSGQVGVAATGKTGHPAARL